MKNLDVYKVSIEYMAIAIKIADNIPRGYSSLANQLKRAAWSIPLKIMSTTLTNTFTITSTQGP